MNLKELLVDVKDVTRLECPIIKVNSYTDVYVFWTTVLINSILVQHLGQYKAQGKDISWHISSKFTKEMSSKSVVVSCHIDSVLDAP